jgi:hypothetical protein
MSNQGLVQAAVRTRHGQPGNRSYNEDWHCLFDEEDIYITDDGTPEADRIPGTYNERLLKWINKELTDNSVPGAPYNDLPGAKQAFAEWKDAYNWSSLTTI